ncbi:uncharacterized protein LOC133186538 [Saccostrea echinata]|uniref:uncharacterized protein LOC133186538 n=1 Tax=Saccostrea echinata TaxID=191078 RepID=UPI002A804680|nr:uncharacterized protein LOC133186538 [Saccostrea echinata]
MSEFKVFGENHRSAEHAFQITKAIRNGDLVAAEKIRSATTALDAKRIGDCISKNESWEKEKTEVMSTIIDAKASQIKPFQEALQKCGPKSIIAEATYDDFWGTGINISATLKTNPEAWPGKNMLGTIIKDIAKNYRRKPRSWSLPRQPTRKAARASQKEITDFVSQLKEGPSKRSRENINDTSGHDTDTSEQG